MRWIGVVVLIALLAAPAVADNPPAKQPPAAKAAARITVQPGQIATWRSPRIGAVRSLYVRINRSAADYNLVPRTNNCVAYIYGAGVAVRITDCVQGRRVPYVRVRAVSAALDPVAVTLRLN